jgi:hypothetical protein
MFSEKQLEQLRKDYALVTAKRVGLMGAFINRTYGDPRAKEFATHGFARRVKTLGKCMDNVFRILPPDRRDLPSMDEVTDATVSLQAFVLNIFGATDNLAWIWVREKGLTLGSGAPIPNVWVGLRKKPGYVRSTLSAEFQTYLTGLDDWFDMQENFRHALAHRIPLYVPPYGVPEGKVQAFQDLSDRMVSAMKRFDFVEYERLSGEQEALGVFRPEMTHSFEEQPGTIVFHAQMLADFNTIEEIGKKMLAELSR